MTRALVLVLSVLTVAEVCAAGDEPRRPPRVEVAGQLGGFGVVGEGFSPFIAAGPRVSVTLTDRLGLDASFEAFIESDDLPWLYQFQGRYVLRPGDIDRGAIFLTGGVAGGLRGWEIETPFALVGGIGTQRVFTRYTAFRADGQAMIGFHGGWVVRGSLGISVPIGRYR